MQNVKTSNFFFTFLQKSHDKDLTYLINMFPTVDPDFLFQKVLEFDGDRTELEDWVFKVIDRKQIDQLPKFSEAKAISEVKIGRKQFVHKS